MTTIVYILRAFSLFLTNYEMIQMLRIDVHDLTKFCVICKANW